MPAVTKMSLTTLTTHLTKSKKIITRCATDEKRTVNVNNLLYTFPKSFPSLSQFVLTSPIQTSPKFFVKIHCKLDSCPPPTDKAQRKTKKN